MHETAAVIELKTNENDYKPCSALLPINR